MNKKKYRAFWRVHIEGEDEGEWREVPIVDGDIAENIVVIEPNSEPNSEREVDDATK